MSNDKDTMPASERDAFGYWLSGFVDGEGSFILDLVAPRHKQPIPYPRLSFAINLRADDGAILREIRDFWGIGRVYPVWKNGSSRPGATYRITRIPDMSRVVIPHFERYPLRAKKRRDFVTWRHGVELACRVMSGAPPAFGRRRWSDHDLAEFAVIMTAHKAQRRYEVDGEIVPIMKPPPDTTQLDLF